jgi:subtilase family serine protease
LNPQIDTALAPVGDVGALGLGAGETREQCTAVYLPESGSHHVSLRVDRDGAVAEMNERNNQISTTIDLAPPAPAPAPAPSPAPIVAPRNGTAVNGTPTGADLTVSAIRIKGQVPDGKDDCTDGKNDVAVVVKNEGKAEAKDFLVRLVVDDDETIEKNVNGLDAGKEQEVRFGSVQLKKGEHELSATADAKETVAESNDGNNTLKVSARCKDAG